MTTLRRIRVQWSGLAGMPGVSTFYCSDVYNMVPDIRTFFASLAGLLPTGLSLQVENVGDIIDDVSGDLVGQWSVASAAVVAATGTGTYAAPVGGAVKWTTGTIVDGNRVAGRTFLVPLMSAAMQSDGTLSTAALGTIQTAASTLVSSALTGFAIWHRPRLARAADGSRPAVTARDGSSAGVTGSSVRDKVMVLRSRRD